MYLKSIDIFGYKSFAAKTRIDLQPGITGIIGPNGCGKSNIMESVRWCLGEMSWKSLRAGSMVDVIFAGTSRRPALGMTEVTLTFDNASSQLPVQFSEVVVSRRIYRSGESEYFLNKTQCRLRDVRELFLDTGVGGDGYAIIDQGGVDFIITSKPEERRSLFEEAAGVAKYRAKREEALRKLDRVDMDMGRLQDSLSLITEQVKKLDSDARKARLYQKYKEELKGLEVSHLLGQIATLGGELEALLTLLRPAEERVGQKKVELDGEGANLSAFQLERANQQNLVIAGNQAVAEIKARMGRLEERISQISNAIAEGARRGAVCLEELEAASAHLAGIDPQIDQARAAAAAADAEAAAAREAVEKSGERLAAAEADIASAEGSAEAVRGETLRAVDAVLSRRREHGALEGRRTHQEATLCQTLRGLGKDSARSETAAQESAELRRGLSEQAERAAASREAGARAEAALSEAAARKTRSEEEILQVRTDLAQSRAKVESLEAEGALDPYWTGAHAVLSSGIEGIVGTVRDLFQGTDDSVKAQLEDALGERLYAVVCEDSTAAKAGVDYLSSSGKGRARFLVLSSLPRVDAERSYPAEAGPLLRRLKWEPKFEGAARFLLGESYTLGKVLFGDHWVSGGAEREASKPSLADVGEWRGRTAELSGRLSELEAGRAAVEAELSAAQAALRAAAAAVQEETGRERELSTRLDHQEKMLASCAADVELGTGECVRMLEDLALMMEERRVVRQAILEAEEAERAARGRENEAAARVAQLREERARRQAAAESQAVQAKALADKASVLQGSVDSLAMEKERQEALIVTRRGELADLEARKAEALSQQERSREELEVLKGELADAERGNNALQEKLRELELAVAAKEDVLRALRAELESAQAEFSRHQLAAGDKRSRGDMLKTRLWDDWQLAEEEARTKFAGVPADPERMESLRKKVSSLGNINMAAPEEYEALSSRQAFLTGQLEDLNRAKEDLRNAIQKINASTRENFRQTFVEVREHFRRLYGVLFEGGEADLVLTNPDDILETGVEIVAQPPGKKLQSMSLLSGGEKALTAIALLFAFFTVKPSPFCMLDEADAALDDANVERFTNILREFQERTQFLIVSHNKRTMEAADVIYGVTMEEMGVSQLISVDFRKKNPGERPVPRIPAAPPASAELPPPPKKREFAAVSAAPAPEAAPLPEAPAAVEPVENAAPSAPEPSPAEGSEPPPDPAV